MFTENNLYHHYKQRHLDFQFTKTIPDITKRTTLDNLNYAINTCKHWDSALDIGCGNGHYLAALTSKFRKCLGIEIDSYPEHDELTKKYSNISFFHDSVENFPKRDHFDFILLMDIFEHIPDINSFAQKIASLQKKDGIIYIITPNPIYCGPSEESLISATRVGYHGHIKHYSKKEIVTIMETVGYVAEFYIYEEMPSREFVRRIARGLSRRDKKFSNIMIYHLFSPIIHLILSPFLWILEKWSSWQERKNRFNKFDTRSLGIVFKKQTT